MKKNKPKRYMFICAYGQNRSPTAVKVANNIAERARIDLVAVHLKGGIFEESLDDLGAQYMTKEFNNYDKLFVMEEYMKCRLIRNYKIPSKKIISLEIPDRYRSGDSKLVKILENKLESWIK